MSIQDYLNKQLGISEELSPAQIQAIKNLMMLSVERVWIGQAAPNAPDPDHIHMSVDISSKNIDIARESFNTCKDLIESSTGENINETICELADEVFPVTSTLDPIKL